ncbi:MAG: PIG-L family deacetylase [Planctomycetota bacterium]
MKALYPPITDPATLPRRVLVIAPHPDDEIFGCGGLLALQARQGATIRIVIVSDGAAGDPAGRESNLARKRIAESLRGAEILGLNADHRFLALPDGKLGEVRDLPDRLATELAEYEPELVYAPSAQELHPDHRAVSRAAIAALARGPERRVLFYDVNVHAMPTVVFDTTAVYEQKRAAVEGLASQLSYQDLVTKGNAFDSARTVNIEDPAVRFVEGYTDLSSRDVARYERLVNEAQRLAMEGESHPAEAWGWPATTAVISTWNKADVLRENLASLRAQTLPFAAMVVVDNHSDDGTARMVAEEFPEVRLIVMPDSSYGACETFNVGFASAATPLVAILDDDVTLPPRWLEMATARLLAEPATTAIVSTEVIEPGMPEGFLAASRARGRRTMSTFRGCGSLARRAALAEAGFYDERLYIYGNERDLTCRLLNLGYRVVHDPEIEIRHKTPFGMQMGRRSLYYHARNAWITMLKHAPLEDLLRAPFLVLGLLLFRGAKAEAAGAVTDAVGTIGLGRAIRETPGAPWILLRAAFSVLANVPYCLKRRRPVAREVFELPFR